MPVNIPSEEEVLGYFESLSNWGRWGDDDQLGTLNLLSQESTRRGFTTVSEHVAVSCARTVSYEPTLDAPKPALHFMTNSGEGDNPRVAVDFFGMVFHGSTITHMDSLAHFFWKGQMYNGRPSHLVSTAEGATVESIDLAGGGIVTRGILVDAPLIRGVPWLERGEGVMPDDILEAERRHGFKITEGDVLLVRTGQLTRRGVEGGGRDNGVPGGLPAAVPRTRHRGAGHGYGQRRQAHWLPFPDESGAPGGDRRDGAVDTRQREPGRFGRGVQETGPLRIPADDVAAQANEYHRIPGQPARHLLRRHTQWQSTEQLL